MVGRCAGTRAAGHRLDRGWIGFLTRPRDLPALVRFTGSTQTRVRSVVAALAGIGVVEIDGDEIRLTQSYADLMSPEAMFSLHDLLAEGRMMRRLVAAAVSDEEPAFADEDVLVVADAYGLRPTSVALEVLHSLWSRSPRSPMLCPRGAWGRIPL